MNVMSEINNIISKIPDINWEKLSKSKIYFAHMSVGYNIIEGIQDLMKNNPAIKLDIRETYNPENFIAPVFGHSQNGNNGDPKSKIDAFVNKMDGGLGNKINAAMLKLCYVDVTSETDVDAVFNYYTDKMDAVKKKYPGTALIHFTVPLTVDRKITVKEKIKDMIKSVIGRTTTREQLRNDNIKRGIFNELLRKHYNEKEIFDIAKFESAYPDGKREMFLNDGKSYYALIPEYSNDGGHLNEAGRKLIAAEFLVFLSGSR